MADESTESVLLDPGRFDSATRRWDIPILRINGVKPKELYVASSMVPSSEFSVENSILKLSEKYNITRSTKCYLIVSFDETNLKIQFWLPIILAIIGFLGAISQPILHTIGLLYSPQSPINVMPVRAHYDAPINSYSMSLVVNNLTGNFSRDWRLVLAVREESHRIEPRDDAFRFISEPFPPEQYLELEVRTDDEFTKALRADRLDVQGCLFRVRTGVNIRSNAFPQNLDTNTCILLDSISVGPLATEKEVTFH